METMRVIGDEICYRAKDCQYMLEIHSLIFFLLEVVIFFSLWLISLSDLTIHKLFATRADLHRTVYTHAKVKVNISTVELQNSICSLNISIMFSSLKNNVSSKHLKLNALDLTVFICQAIELMVTDALLKANDSLGISSSIHQPAEFWKVCTFRIGRVCLGASKFLVMVLTPVESAVGWLNIKTNWNFYWTWAQGIKRLDPTHSEKGAISGILI